jgi:hypothetical protein
LRALAEGSLQLAAHASAGNRYLNRLEIDDRLDGLRPPSSDPAATYRAWTTPVVGDDVAARRRSLGQLPSNTIGRHVHDFCVLLGFAFPARWAPRHPAREQDWVHILADYGTVEAEIEVFGFIARASDAPNVFALHLDELRRDLGVPPKSPETTAAGSVRPWHPDGVSHAQRAAAASGRAPTGTLSPGASEAGAVTANPCDPTATAQEEGP